jgi:general secretion pathway protein G
MKTNHRSTSAAHAFTLLEMMIVLLIIAMILGVVAAGVNGFQTKAEITTTDAKVQSLVAHLSSYKTIGAMYPTQGQGLNALLTKPSDPAPKRWSPSLKSETDLLDVWGTKFLYRYPGVHNPSAFDVYSAGPDRQPETEDDIGNW